MKRLEKEVKGVTLVALVVTIIILLILAGIAINLGIGNNGLFSRSQRAKEEYENARKDEEKYLENLESSIKVADSDDAEITIKLKDLKTLIQETVNEEMNKGTTGINEKSLLLISTNSSLGLGEYKLNTFTNTFTDGEFEKYFDYDATTGDLVCKQEGWYLIDTSTDLCGYTNLWTDLRMKMYVNNVELSDIISFSSALTGESTGESPVSAKLKVGDRVTVKKSIGQSVAKSRANCIMKIFKL